MSAFPAGTRVRNRVTDELATVTGSIDVWGNIGIRYDDPPEGEYHASPGRIEVVEQLTDCVGDPLLNRRAA